MPVNARAFVANASKGFKGWLAASKLLLLFMGLLGAGSLHAAAAAVANGQAWLTAQVVVPDLFIFKPRSGEMLTC